MSGMFVLLAFLAIFQTGLSVPWAAKQPMKLSQSQGNKEYEAYWHTVVTWDVKKEGRSPTLEDGQNLARSCFDWVKDEPNARSRGLKRGSNPPEYSQEYGNIIECNFRGFGYSHEISY
jgi:hypothetical protein